MILTMCMVPYRFFVPCHDVERSTSLSYHPLTGLFHIRRFLPYVGYVTIAMVRTSRLLLKYFDVFDIHIPRTIFLDSNTRCLAYWG